MIADFYRKLAYTENASLYECKECGVVVVNVERHNAWHVRYEKVADDAYWGGMNRPIG